MKNRLLRNVLTATFILAVSACFVNVHGQVQVIFENGDVKADHRTAGIAGRDALHLNYTIDGSGNISMEAVSPSTDEKVLTLLESWGGEAGSTDIASLFGKSFSLVLSTNGPRLDCREKGGLGLSGMNSGRIDNTGKESLYIVLEGSVGINFDSLMYEKTERGGGDKAHFLLSDHDPDSLLYYLPEGDSVFTPTDTTFVLDSMITFDHGVLEMRFASDSLLVTCSDTLADGGGRLLGLYFTLMEPTNPAVAGLSPVSGDTLLDVSSDFVILFNVPMNTATTEAAVTITPALTNRVNTWDAAGEELTITSDDLDFFTDYVLAISTDAESADGTNSILNFNYAYQSLPDAPTVVYAYPVKQGKTLPLNTPLAIQFSRPMNTDSVQNAISFEPALDGLYFVWNENNTLAYMISDSMVNTSYTVTISTIATDVYGVQFADSYTYTFNTWAVSVEDIKASEVVLYPNPASDLLEIRGMDVSSAKIYSLTGQLMKEVYNSSVINVSDMEPGSYAVTITDRDDTIVRKLIVIQ
ncbi:MAG: T9SS type A sorting domain-containing protein [Gammaproteobacteria bacterium]|nr:T9SS type A sorting domain-containing protein [Gammaproteobacteria bacterium]